MPAEKTLVYLILGAAGSGRRAILVDLIEAGLEKGERPAVMLSEGEAASDFDARLPELSRWAWRDEMIVGSLPSENTHVFFVLDGAQNPIEQIEVFKVWLESQGGEVARVLCVVNSQLAEKHAALLAWFEACVHFSDVVLLNKREGVDNKWMSDFLTHFKKLYYPCLFEPVKASRVKNPALILDPQARRMTHVFDAEQDWIFTNAEGKVIDEQEEDGDSDEEVEAKVEEDPYFVRDAAGRRAKRLPEIAKYLTADKDSD